ncbi:MAG TPA: LptF/LptG family permease [Candidatus Baltobacteraceae bacterium]|nr:LptF/LptG family permease [Candidatus Baltobacteraceae bacterium]
MATLTERQPHPGLRLAALRIPILDRYLLREMLLPFFAGLFAYLIFWALNIFFVAADYIINQHAPFFLVLRFVLYRVPQATPMAFPFGVLLAGLLAMGRLMGDNEITAMRTSGVPVWRIALTPLLFGFVMFGLSYAINENIAPSAVDISTRTFYQILYHTDALPVEPQFFRKDPDTGNVFYVNQVLPDNKTMEGVQVFKLGRYGIFVETLQAKTATVEGTQLALHDVIDTRYGADGMMTSQQHVKEALIGLPLAETAAQFMSNQNSDPWTMSSKNLSAQVKSLQQQGIGGSALGNLEINLYNKLSWPFASFIAVILAVPLAMRYGKRGQMLGIAMAILAFFGYFLLTSAAAALGRNGKIDPLLAAWLPNIIMGGTGLVLLWLEEH